jgi:hypothetical protein
MPQWFTSIFRRFLAAFTGLVCHFYIPKNSEIFGTGFAVACQNGSRGRIFAVSPYATSTYNKS